MVLPARRRLRRLGFIVAFRAAPAFGAAVVALAPRAASAQDAYRQHMENGVKLFNDRNYPGALIEFRAAYAAKPKATPLVNIALCHKAVFNYPKAIQALEQALRDHPNTMDPQDKRAAEDAIKEMKGLLAYITVRVTPAKANITVDDEDLGPGAAASPIPLGPGKHKIGAKLDGHAPQETYVTVASGQKGQTVTFALVPDKGWVVIHTAPEMIIAVDSTPVAKGSYQAFLVPGTHLVQIYAPGKPGYSVQLPVVAGRTSYVRPGVGGVPVVIGPPAPAPVVPVPPPPTIMPKKVEKPPEPPAGPPRRGLYGMVTTMLVWPIKKDVYERRTPVDNSDRPRSYSINSGGAFGVRGGYRINNPAAVEGMFEYQSIFQPRAGQNAEDLGFEMKTVRLGANLRLMTLGKTVRFVGILGGGITWNQVQFDTDSNGKIGRGGEGVDPFGMAEVGIELDFGGVLLGAAGTGIFQSSRGIDDGGADSRGVYNRSAIGFLGIGLRAGYAFW
jgi:hypothetical protein